jgi:uncharacterized protein
MDQKLDQPLSDFEFDRLEMILSQLQGDRVIRTLEGIDGFFAALVCSPSLVPPGEYLPEIWGEDLSEQDELSSLEQVQDLLNLLSRHWNAVTRAFSTDEIFIPLLLRDEKGVVGGNDWAQGFLLGMDMRRDEWGSLLDDEEGEAMMLPIFILAYEHDSDPEMRPEPIPEEKRDDLVTLLAVAVNHIYRRFEKERRSESIGRWASVKTGRNEPCPCGSGLKYKRCCGAVTVQ